MIYFSTVYILIQNIFLNLLLSLVLCITSVLAYDFLKKIIKEKYLTMAKALLLGGSGAMGVYLVPELIRLGFDIVVTSRSVRKSDNDKLAYIQGNAHEEEFIKKILADKYDVIVDFMVYPTKEFLDRYELFLKNTKHYIFISSCRVFAESDEPITENTPRLLDVSKDTEYLATDEYALAKARQENILRESPYKNWTIIRPSITYSKNRFQLGTLEADTIIFRTQCNCPVILPQEMLQKQTSMTWAGDVAKMIAHLVLNQNAFEEDYNTVSHEHCSWEDIFLYYQKLIGLKLIPVKLDDYIKIIGGKYQVLLSRMYNRVMDNTKILKATGIPKESLISIYDGLSRELQNPNISKFIKIDYVKNAGMDRITHSKISLEKANVKEKFLYYSSYLGVYMLLKYVKNRLNSHFGLLSYT